MLPQIWDESMIGVVSNSGNSLKDVYSEFYTDE